MSAPTDPREVWRIIATDDSASKLSPIVDTLREAGHCVFAAYDGRSALELVVQLPSIDLLITNTRLGRVEGPELIRETRELRPGMPILHVIQEGERDHDTPPDVLILREPFTPGRLLTAVRGLLAQARR